MSESPELIIETARLLIREFAECDFAAVHAYGSDPEVVRFMAWGPNTEQETRDFLLRATGLRCATPRVEWELAVATKIDGALIGGCGLYIRSRRWREGEIGYCFDRRVWGHGYATEAARAIVDFGFDTLGLHRIFATCDPENVGSARVLEKIGMRREGYLRENVLVRGVWRDTLLYAILEGDPRPTR